MKLRVTGAGGGEGPGRRGSRPRLTLAQHLAVTSASSSAGVDYYSVLNKADCHAAAGDVGRVVRAHVRAPRDVIAVSALTIELPSSSGISRAVLNFTWNQSCGADARGLQAAARHS